MVVGVGGGRRDSAEREAEDARFVRFFKDDESKAAISSTCDNLLRTYMREGRLEKKTLQKEIWELSSAMVTKWGDPNKLMACSECAKKTGADGRFGASTDRSPEKFVEGNRRIAQECAPAGNGSEEYEGNVGDAGSDDERKSARSNG